MRVNAVNEQLAFLRCIKAASTAAENRTAKIKLTSLTLSTVATILRRKSALTRSKSIRYVTAHKVAPRLPRVLFDRMWRGLSPLTFIPLNFPASPVCKAL